MTEDETVELTLHQEVVRSDVQRVATKVARLRRIVVRERRTIEVEVAHEEFRVVVEDLEPGTDDGGGAREASTVLREERIEIVRRVVPVERITLTAHRVERGEVVDVEVRHEEVGSDLT